MSEVFELVSRQPNQVVIKVNADDNLVVAMNPYINKEMDYITVTRGSNHTLTVIRKNGTTWSFDWGDGGYTLIGDSTKRLKNEVIKFIEYECNIPLEWDDGKVTKASIFYNRNYDKWQLTLEGDRTKGYNRAHLWFNDMRSWEEVAERAKDYIRASALKIGIIE